MSDTTTISQIKASHVAWALGLVAEWGETGAEFYAFPDGEHIIVSDRVAGYRLSASEFAELAEGMLGGTATLPANGVRNDGAELTPDARKAVMTSMNPSDVMEECTLLPIGFANPFGTASCTTLCVSASGRVEVIQTQYLDPVKNVDGVVFMFNPTTPDILAIQGDLCVATCMPLRPFENDEAMRRHAIIDRIARAAYEIVQSEARS